MSDTPVVNAENIVAPQRAVQGIDIVNALVPRLIQAEMDTLAQFEIPYNAVVASLIESAHTSCAVKSAVLSGMTRERYLEAAGVAYDLTYKNAEARGLTQGMELARKSVEDAQKVFNEIHKKT